MKNFKESKVLEIIIVSALVLIGAGLRFIPFLPNFVPIGALALFGGVYFSRKIALVLPLAAMSISDIFIGYYELKLMFFVYGGFLLYVLLGFWLKKNKQWYMISGSIILGAVLFFLITNFAVWALTPWYTKNFSGIIQCFLMALPFLRNTLFGDLFYTTVFFGGYEFVKILIKEKNNKKNFMEIKTIIQHEIN